MRISYFIGRTVLITGASAGIGYEFARQLAPVVSTMVLVARRNDRLAALKSELKVINPKLELFSRPLDLRDKDELERFCDWLDESDLAIDSWHYREFGNDGSRLPPDVYQAACVQRTSEASTAGRQTSPLMWSANCGLFLSKPILGPVQQPHYVTAMTPDRQSAH